jgi:lipopolysaccharide transport system ATP-binding protein
LTNLNSVDCGDDGLAIYPTGYLECSWPRFNCRAGTYECNLFCTIDGEVVDWIQSAFFIDVEDGDYFGTGKLIDRNQGDILVDYSWTSVRFGEE